MSDQGAADALVAAMMKALSGVPGLSGVFDGAPRRAGDAHAVVETGPETDWGHKSGAGAELRLALLIRCDAESPARARALSGEARAAMEAIGPQLNGGWRLVGLVMMRARVVAAGRKEERPGWTGVVDYRARLLREEG